MAQCKTQHKPRIVEGWRELPASLLCGLAPYDAREFVDLIVTKPSGKKVIHINNAFVLACMDSAIRPATITTFANVVLPGWAMRKYYEVRNTRAESSLRQWRAISAAVFAAIYIHSGYRTNKNL